MTVTTGDLATTIEALPARASLARRTWGLIRRQPLGAAGLLFIVIMAVFAVGAEWLTSFDPEEQMLEHMLEAPNWQFILGTDNFGRDIWTRIVYGSQTALLIGFVAATGGSVIGLVLGVGSAYFGGLVDLIFQRVMDVFLAFPSIIMALAVVSVLGTGIENVIIAIMLPMIPQCARVVRSSALSIREIPYVDAARALGYGHARIILRHMTPNVMAPFLIMFTSFVGSAILAEASLSYLGLGVQEPVPAWGLMLQGGAEEYAESAPWAAIFPGLAITFAVFAFNLFGDAVRDVLDPKLRSR